MSEQLIQSISIASPCSVGWETMTGDEKVRHCRECKLSVYNISSMTQQEVGDLIIATEGNFCGRIFRRFDGTILTRDCPLKERLANAFWSNIEKGFLRAAATVFGLLGISVGAQIVASVVNGPHTGKIRIDSPKADMHTAQLSVESYGTDCAGTYPRTAAEMLPYYPGGENKPGGFPGYLHKKCVLMDISPTAFGRVHGRPVLKPNAIQQQIAPVESDTHWVGYCSFPDSSGKVTSYAVIGGKGHHIAEGNSGYMVLSNIEPNNEATHAQKRMSGSGRF